MEEMAWFQQGRAVGGSGQPERSRRWSGGSWLCRHLRSALPQSSFPSGTTGYREAQPRSRGGTNAPGSRAAPRQPTNRGERLALRAGGQKAVRSFSDE